MRRLRARCRVAGWVSDRRPSCTATNRCAEACTATNRPDGPWSGCTDRHILLCLTTGNPPFSAQWRGEAERMDGGCGRGGCSCVDAHRLRLRLVVLAVGAGCVGHRRYAPTAERLEALPGVTEVTARYWQPDDSHCVSREYLETAAWSADFTVQVRAGFTLEQVRSVRSALGASGDGHRCRWQRLRSLGARGGESVRCDTGTGRCAADGGRARVPAGDRGCCAPGRDHRPAGRLRADSSSVAVGTATTWTTSVSVTGVMAASDTSVEAAATVTATHPDLMELSVSGSGVTGVVPTERQGRDVVTAFEETPADSDGQRVTVWWPDGNGSQASGIVGSGR